MKTCILCLKKIRRRGGKVEEAYRTRQGNFIHKDCYKIADEMMRQKMQMAVEEAKAKKELAEQEQHQEEPADASPVSAS